MANVQNEDKTVTLDLFGGCPFVVDPTKPHLGGNMRGGDGGTDYSADLWPWLVEKYKIKTLLDVGCAEGHAVKAFRKLGVEAIGVDGLAQNARRCEIPTVVHDLTKGPFRVECVEWIWCCDMVEHVEEQFVPNLLETFRCAKYVALCHGTDKHALNGWHHVNNKPVEYWAEKMRSAGFALDVQGTEESRKLTAHRQYWPDSGRIWKAEKWPVPF